MLLLLNGENGGEKCYDPKRMPGMSCGSLKHVGFLLGSIIRSAS
jgi:hypothetical protein